MNFMKIFSVFVVIFSVLALSTAAPEPRWKFWKKVEKVGQNVRDGIIKAGPAVAVVGEAASLG